MEMDCERCGERAVMWVSERYEAPDGMGAIERDEAVCVDCAGEVEPEGLDGVYARYEFRIEPIPEEFGMRELSE